jgi:MtN3 and saliva related transmembrane protein
MTSDEINLIGYIAAACTTLCWLPQAVRTIRTRDTRAISLWTQGIFAVGTGFWLVYGLLIASVPVVLSNGLVLPLILVIIVMKLRYG